MKQTDHLVEQHIREYESRLRHIDELMERAREKGATPDSDTEMAEIARQREEAARHVVSLKENQERRETEDILSAGPMGILVVLAQKIEHVIERLEK